MVHCCIEIKQPGGDEGFLLNILIILLRMNYMQRRIGREEIKVRFSRGQNLSLCPQRWKI